MEEAGSFLEAPIMHKEYCRTDTDIKALINKFDRFEYWQNYFSHSYGFFNSPQFSTPLPIRNVEE